MGEEDLFERRERQDEARRLARLVKARARAGAEREGEGHDIEPPNSLLMR